MNYFTDSISNQTGNTRNYDKKNTIIQLSDMKKQNMCFVNF